MASRSSSFFDGFFNGFFGSGMFMKLRLPGAPTEIIDSRGVEAIYNSGEFEAARRRFHAAVEAKAADDRRRVLHEPSTTGPRRRIS